VFLASICDLGVKITALAYIDAELSGNTFALFTLQYAVSVYNKDSVISQKFGIVGHYP